MLPPRGMTARLALVLVVALAIEFSGNVLLGRLLEREAVSEQKFRAIAAQLATAGEVAADVDRSGRSRLMADMAIDGLRLNWVSRTVIVDTAVTSPQLGQVHARLGQAAPGLRGRDLRLSVVPLADGRRDLIGALRLADGSFVTFRVHPFLNPPPSQALVTVLHLLLLASVLGIALAMLHALVRPLGNLARAADATGRGMRAEMPLDGPSEVRRVATAFRDMQSRLLGMMEDHATALVAVSHDLRTPIQRARLRAVAIEDSDLRDAIVADLADMEKFVGSVTAFIQSGAREEARPVDLAAMAMTLVDDAADAGFLVEYDGPDTLPVVLKPLAMKRALANLLQNACRHARRIRVSVEAGPPVAVRVEDDGPGIPTDRREEAFLPFRRLDPERGGDGTGLGLAIVRNAAASMGASVTLEDSPMGGLAARIDLLPCKSLSTSPEHAPYPVVQSASRPPPTGA